MADEDNEQTPALGRGRGRGTRTDPEVRGTSSSTSEKRSQGNGNGNGNGKKRGTTRDQRTIQFVKTKPAFVENSKKGTTGRPLKLSANYFKLARKPAFQFRMYHVSFEPDIEVAMMRKAFVAKEKPRLGGYLFDGQSSIYLTRQLEQSVMVFEIVSREGATYKMTIKDTEHTIEMNDAMANQVLNIILRRSMDGLKMQLVGRNMYDPENKVDIREFRVELWPGYVTSIRQHEQEVLVCCEVSHKVMRQETVYDIIKNCRKDYGSDWQDSFKREIIGSTILTAYNNNTYKIDDVDFRSSPSSVFLQKGVEVAYYDYYKKKYNLEIRDRNQPMLVSNPNARDRRAGKTQHYYLVPELCRSTGLTDKMRANFQMMRAMADHTQMDPDKRKNRLMDFTKRIHQSRESMDTMNSFNCDLDQQLVHFEGRALPQETILFGNDRSATNDNRVDWTNPMKNNQMYTSVPLKRWFFIFPKRAENDSRDFLEHLRTVAGGMRYDMGEPKIEVLSDDRTGTYIACLNGCIAKDPKMIVIVVPNNAGDRYAAIKRLTCVNNAIPTQVIVQKTMMPKKGNIGGVLSIATKVMIQINSKLGGAPWMINFPLKGTMTIGFDVTHDTTDKSKSYGAFVASMDLKQVVKYYSAASHHKDGNEMSQNIEFQMSAALRAFMKTHGTLPERIFFFRDGVGDGQIEYVYSQEVTRLAQHLNSIYATRGEGKTPKFTFIIVNKRINTRIFQCEGSRFSNPNAGTVVDDVITLPERYDFYLVSQSVRQGTVAPTSYNVIHDTNGLPPDKLQILTYKQTHLYYNWSGCTRVPAVVQYAHKLAFLVGQHLHQPPSTHFDNLLYFL